MIRLEETDPDALLRLEKVMARMRARRAVELKSAQALRA